MSDADKSGIVMMPGMYDRGGVTAASLSEEQAASRPPGTPCSCARLPMSASSDRLYSVRWLGSHDRVEVVLNDGMVLVGQPWLTSFANSLHDRVGYWHLGVVTEDGARVLAPLGDIVSITPVGVTSEITLLRQVYDLIDHPETIEPGDSRFFTLPVSAEDEHEYVRVTVQRVVSDRGCARWPTPAPTSPQSTP